MPTGDLLSVGESSQQAGLIEGNLIDTFLSPLASDWEIQTALAYFKLRKPFKD